MSQEDLANILKSADPEVLKQLLAASPTAGLRESYAHHLKDDADAPTVSVAISDWRSIQMVLADVPGPDNNPGGGLFPHLLEDVKAAIKAKDGDRLFLDLLLIYKAVGR